MTTADHIYINFGGAGGVDQKLILVDIEEGQNRPKIG